MPAVGVVPETASPAFVGQSVTEIRDPPTHLGRLVSDPPVSPHLHVTDCKCVPPNLASPRVRGMRLKV